MNLFFKASVPEALLQKTAHVAEWQWFTRDEFLQQDMHPSYDKSQLVGIIFGAE